MQSTVPDSETAPEKERERWENEGGYWHNRGLPLREEKRILEIAVRDTDFVVP